MNPLKPVSLQRVAVYIDGFNLYYGLKSKRQGRRGKPWPCYYWLDVRRLSESLLDHDQTLVLVRYFTARVRDNQRRLKRQNTYLEALDTLPDVEIHEGYFTKNESPCKRCGHKKIDYEEKKTDVNIAVEILGDAQDDLFDTAIMISGDGDLVAPVEAVLKRYPDKEVIVAFPPDRHSANLANVASDQRKIEKHEVSRSQLPNQLKSNAGYPLKKPARWDR